MSFNCSYLPCVLKIITFLHVLINYIHNHVFFCVMRLLILTKRLLDSDTDHSSCYQDVTAFSREECNGGTHKNFNCLHLVTCVHGPLIRGCKVLIGPHWGDIINTIKRPDHVSKTQSKFRPGLDPNPIFGIEILR